MEFLELKDYKIHKKFHLIIIIIVNERMISSSLTSLVPRSVHHWLEDIILSTFFLSSFRSTHGGYKSFILDHRLLPQEIDSIFLGNRFSRSNPFPSHAHCVRPIMIHWKRWERTIHMPHYPLERRKRGKRADVAYDNKFIILSTSSRLRFPAAMIVWIIFSVPWLRLRDSYSYLIFFSDRSSRRRGGNDHETESDERNKDSHSISTTIIFLRLAVYHHRNLETNKNIMDYLGNHSLFLGCFTSQIIHDNKDNKMNLISNNISF